MTEIVAPTNLQPENGYRGMTFAITKDLVTGECLHYPMNSIVVLNKEDGDDVVFLVNCALRSTNRVKYKLKNIDGFYGELLLNGFLAIRFTEPRHMIVMHTSCLRQRVLFLEWFLHPFLTCMYLIYDSLKMDDAFDPNLAEFTSISRFNRNNMNIGCLSTVILEGVDLSSVPADFGHTPVSYISLSGSNLGLSNYEPETFWDWMTKPTICKTLEVLEMNSNNLEKLPFEIIFLKNLTVLSVSDNKLTCIPRFTGELKKLRCLFFNNNKVPFLPESLQTRTFDYFSCKNNDFDEFNRIVVAKMMANKKPKDTSNFKKLPSLSHLALFSLIDKNVHFRRQDLSLSILRCFDNLYRCAACHKLMITDGGGRYQLSFVKTKCFMQTEMVNWEYFKCDYKCIDYDNPLPFFLREDIRLALQR